MKNYKPFLLWLAHQNTTKPLKDFIIAFVQANQNYLDKIDIDDICQDIMQYSHEYLIQIVETYEEKGYRLKDIINGTEEIFYLGYDILINEFIEWRDIYYLESSISKRVVKSLKKQMAYVGAKE